MNYFSHVKLRELLLKLESVKRDSISPGKGVYCENSIVDLSGNSFRKEYKPRCNISTGHEVGGHLIKQDENGKYIEIPLGVHGRSMLVINEDGDVCCSCKANGV